MRRPYRAGDTFVVPLDDASRAGGVVLEMHRRAPLVAFDGFCAYVGDAALVLRRWPVTGRLRPFDRVTFPVAESERIEAPEIVQERLQALRDARVWRRSHMFAREIRTPVDIRALDQLPGDARVQWRAPLRDDEVEAVARWIRSHPEASVRIYDAAARERAQMARVDPPRLSLDVRTGERAGFAQLTSLRSLDVAGVPADLPDARGLRRLVLRGQREDVVDVKALAGFEHLEALSISGAQVENAELLAALPKLRALCLRNARGLRDLTWLSQTHLEALWLDGLLGVDDVRPIASVPWLRHLELRGAWQLSLDDVAWLRDAPGLVGLTLDIGGRRKNAEIFKAHPRGFAAPFAPFAPF